jgi:hypothetical protein
MPQLDFFLVREDELRLIRLIFELGAELVVGGQHDSPKYKRLKGTIEYLEERQRGACLFHVVSETYNQSPLAMGQVDDGPNRGRYFVRQRTGGPTIDFFSPAPPGGDKVLLAPSMLGYYRTYLNTLTSQNENVPAELKRVFSKLAHELKRDAVRVDTGRRKYWITPNANELRAKGASFAGL